MFVQIGQWAAAIVLFVVILWAVVMVHEVGHFVTARLARVRVLEFGLGYPPRAKVLHDDGETAYTLNWLPIGGFVLMEGEESTSEDAHSFSAASLPRQITIMAAGAAMNVVLAFTLFFVVAWLASPLAGVRFADVEPGSPAALAGLTGGETIESVNGQRVGWMDAGVLDAIRSRAGQTVTLGVVDGAGRHDAVTVTLRSATEIAALTAADGQQHGALGISSPNGMRPVFTYVQTDPISAAGTAASETWNALGTILGSLRDLGASIVSNPAAAPPAAGPIGIAEQVHSSLFDLGPVFVLILAALLSANLALVNLLPFPPLDGGKIVVMIVKRAVGSRTTGRLEQLTYLVGFVLLLSFVAWISYFDIVRGLAGQ